MTAEITIDIARKVLTVVDAGLVSSVGKPIPGQMCVEAAVCYALDLPHGDDPACVSRALRRLKINLNDRPWSSPQARANGLRRLAVAQLGSRDHLDDKEFSRRVAELAIRKSVSEALRAAASIQKDHIRALREAAAECERQPTRENAKKARAAAASAAASAAAYAASAAAYAADAAASAAAAAAADAAAAAASAAYAADAAASAAAAASSAAAAASARDESLAGFAEAVVQILIEMKAPGCQWLVLTEAA